MNAPTFGERLAFFGMREETPAPSLARARVDAACSTSSPPTPEERHLVHWKVPIGKTSNTELRLTTSNGTLYLRHWIKTGRGEWWPLRAQKGLLLHNDDVQAFSAAVSAAAKALLEGEEKP